MNRRFARYAAGLGILSLAAILIAQTRRVDDAALLNAGKSADEWVTYGRDYAETHYSPLTQIDTTKREAAGPCVVSGN